jgi:hypothetical protein
MQQQHAKTFKEAQPMMNMMMPDKSPAYAG